MVALTDIQSIDYDREPVFVGLRMNAEQFLDLPESKLHYELINGVVVVSPSPTPRHQRVITEVSFQIVGFCRTNELGDVLHDIDVRLFPDTVYRPDIIFVKAGRLDPDASRVSVIPDLVIEVLSPSTKRMDQTTKLEDYERAGVREFWLIDPATKLVRCYILKDAKFVEQTPASSSLASNVIPGFVLDLTALWRRL